MTGIEYMNSLCPTTKNGRDPNREDVADAFEEGIAEGFSQCKKQFIEKACSWLVNNLQGIVGSSIYLEDFRKYMEE